VLWPFTKASTERIHAGSKAFYLWPLSKSVPNKFWSLSHKRVHSSHKVIVLRLMWTKIFAIHQVSGVINVFHFWHSTILVQFLWQEFQKKWNTFTSPMIHTNERFYACDLLPFKVQATSELQRHLRSHTQKSHSSVSVCSKSFTCKGNLTRHLEVHSKSRLYFNCDQCPRKLTTKAIWLDHINRLHSKEKPHKCELCEKRFAIKSDVTLHVIVHTDERSPSCLFCKKDFAHCIVLSTTFVPILRKKPHFCTRCSSEYGQSPHLLNTRRLAWLMIRWHKLINSIYPIVLYLIH